MPLPSQNRYWRVPNHAKEMDGEGRFSVKAPSGEYSLGAIKRSGGLRIGLPGADDKSILSLDASGNPKAYELKANSQLEVVDITEHQQTGESREAAETPTSIVGSITDEDGAPLAGIYAFAFTIPKAVGKPIFASGPSDDKGVSGLT